MRVLAVIPARWASTRLPGKALCDLGGKPLVVRVLEAVLACPRVSRAVVATDDDRIARAVEAAAIGEAEMTSKAHASGTDRIAEVVRRSSEEWVLNVQGDEPFLPAGALETLLDRAETGDPAEVGTLFESIRSRQEWEDPSVVKVATDPEGRALYFSRAPIPAWHPGSNPEEPWVGGKRHVGVYSCSKETLLRWAETPPTPLEKREGLEQLRLLETGTVFRLMESPGRSLGVDTEEHLEEARRRWAAEHASV